MNWLNAICENAENDAGTGLGHDPTSLRSVTRPKTGSPNAAR